MFPSLTGLGRRGNEASPKGNPSAKYYADPDRRLLDPNRRTTSALATKNDLPDAQRSYGSSWRKLPVDEHHAMRVDEHHGGIEEGLAQMAKAKTRHHSKLEHNWNDQHFKEDAEAEMTRNEEGDLPAEAKKKAKMLALHGIWRAPGTAGATRYVEMRMRGTMSLPRMPSPPGMMEMRQQKQMFSTAKMPWLTAKKAPKDDGLEVLVKVLMEAIKDVKLEAPEHGFTQPYNPARATHNFHKEDSAVSSQIGKDKQLRRHILKALAKSPICDVGDMLGCDEKRWASVSKSLDGLGHAMAVRAAMRVQASPGVRPVDRAIYQTALGGRVKNVDRGRVCYN